MRLSHRKTYRNGLGEIRGHFLKIKNVCLLNSANGYEVIKGKRLKDFLNCVLDQDVPDINVGNISNRTP